MSRDEDDIEYRSERDRRLVERFTGERSLREVGEEFGISRQRVYQILQTYGIEDRTASRDRYTSEEIKQTVLEWAKNQPVEKRTTTELSQSDDVPFRYNTYQRHLDRPFFQLLVENGILPGRGHNQSRYSRQALIQSLQDVGEEEGRTPKQSDFMGKKRRPYPSNFYFHFGSFTEALKEAGFGDALNRPNHPYREGIHVDEWTRTFVEEIEENGYLTMEAFREKYGVNPERILKRLNTNSWIKAVWMVTSGQLDLEDAETSERS